MTTHTAIPSQCHEAANGVSRWIRIALTVVVLFLLGTVRTAFAAGNCQYTTQSPTWVTLQASLSGNATVGRDAPIGTVIYTASYTGGFSTGFALLCTAGRYQPQTALVSQPYPLSSYVDPSGFPVYQTPIPGIGVRIKHHSNPVPGNEQPIINPSAPLNSIGTFNFSNFTVELIKISNVVNAGTISGANLPTFNCPKLAWTVVIPRASCCPAQLGKSISFQVPVRHPM